MNQKTCVFSACLLAMGMTGCIGSPGSLVRINAGGIPSISGVLQDRGRLLVTLVHEAGPHIQAIGSITGQYTQADLSLTNSNSLLSGTINQNITISGTSYTAAFASLRPGAGYGLSLSLKNGSGVEKGMGYASNITLVSGQTTVLTAVIGANGNITVSTSTVGNALGSSSSWLIAKGDAINLNTGFNSTETGAASMSVTLDASLYTGGPSIIAAKTLGYNTFAWSTGTTAGLYDASKLTTTGTQDGTVTFTMFNAANNIIGRTTMTHVNVVNGSTIDLQLQ